MPLCDAQEQGICSLVKAFRNPVVDGRDLRYRKSSDMKQTSQVAVHVVIVGGGFGGRYAAQRLANRLPRGSRLTLVDRNDYMLYTPMLTEAAGRSVSPKHIQAPNRELSRKINFVQGELQRADLRRRTITLSSGEVIAADHLVFALGSTTNFHSVEGAEQHSLTLKTLEDARRMRTMAQRSVEEAGREADPVRRARLLSFVVAGGGYTGVETIAALNDLVRDTAREHGVPEGALKLTLIESEKRLMGEMPEDLAIYAQKRLALDGIDVRVGEGVKTVSAGHLTLTSGETLVAGMVIWDTGIQPNPIVKSFDCARGKKGGMVTDSTFRVLHRPGVWAIGDCAEIPKPDSGGKFFEPTAQNATREGTHLADNLVAVIHGRPVKPFRYTQVGELAVISRRRGVAQIYGVHLKGVAAWLLWRAIYVAKMPSLRQRVGLLGDWLRLAIGRRYVPVTWRLPEQPLPPLFKRLTD